MPERHFSPTSWIPRQENKMGLPFLAPYLRCAQNCEDMCQNWPSIMTSRDLHSLENWKYLELWKKTNKTQTKRTNQQNVFVCLFVLSCLLLFLLFLFCFLFVFLICFFWFVLWVVFFVCFLFFIIFWFPVKWSILRPKPSNQREQPWGLAALPCGKSKDHWPF